MQYMAGKEQVALQYHVHVDGQVLMYLVTLASQGPAAVLQNNNEPQCLLPGKGSCSQQSMTVQGESVSLSWLLMTQQAMSLITQPCGKSSLQLVG